MDEKLLKIAAEFIEELKEAPPDDYLQIKLMLLSVVRHKAVDSFLHKNISVGRREKTTTT